MTIWGLRGSPNRAVGAIQTIPLVDYQGELPQRRARFERYCWECGKLVCRYKDPHLTKVYCYAHDHLQDWGYTSLTAGCYNLPRYSTARVDGTQTRATNGKGRGNWKDKRGFDDIHG